MPAAVGAEAAREVLEVDALLDHHLHGVGRVVAAGGHGLVPPGDGGLAHGLRFALANVMRVVHHQAVAPFARDGAAGGGRDAVAPVVVLVTALQVLVTGETPLQFAELLIPGGEHEAAGAHGVTGGELLGVGRAQPLGPGAEVPLPGGPQHADQQALGRAGRDQHQQARQLAVRARLEVLGDAVEMPARGVGGARLGYRPGLGQVLTQAQAWARLLSERQGRGEGLRLRRERQEQGGERRAR